MTTPTPHTTDLEILKREIEATQSAYDAGDIIFTETHTAARAYLDLAQRGMIGQGWQPIETAPMNGTAFYVRYETPMRWLPYKKGYTGPEKGRWQIMNEYGGWDNTQIVPKEWRPHETPPAAVRNAMEVG